MVPPSHRNLLAALALAAASAVLPIQPGFASDEPAAEETAGPEKASGRAVRESADGDVSDRLSAHEYFTLAPFVVPVIDKGEHRKQFVLVAAIALYDEEHRKELRRLSPKMRNEIYQMLFRLVSFRTIEPRIPRTDVLEKKLTVIARRVAGAKMVKAMVVHSAQVTDVH